MRQQMRNARLNPQNSQHQQNQEDNSQQARNDRRSHSDGRPPDAPPNDLREITPDGRAWGILPPTAQEEVDAGRKANVPAAYADEWEEFLKQLASEDE